MNTRKDLKIPLKPAIATCSGLVHANCMVYLTSIRYNLSNISVKNCHTPGTSASATRLDSVAKASKLVPMIIKPTSKKLIPYNPTSLQITTSDKTLNLFKGTGKSVKLP